MFFSKLWSWFFPIDDQYNLPVGTMKSYEATDWVNLTVTSVADFHIWVQDPAGKPYPYSSGYSTVQGCPRTVVRLKPGQMIVIDSLDGYLTRTEQVKNLFKRG